MTNTEIATITAAVIAALNGSKARKYPAVKPAKAYAPKLSKAEVSPSADRSLKRRASVARGFARKGIKVTFVNETGRFDNVKPYKVWLGEGRIVRRGEHGVKGLFHISQCDVYTGPTVTDLAKIAADHSAQVSA
jgi:hypothetical protein